QVYLSMENLQLPKGRVKKLLPKYIGPYTITKIFPRTANYQIDLPEDLKRRRVHNMFHINRLHRHEANDNQLFPH
ncbi:hypothetical protein BDW22DRAFT_1339917, partial [Trametopsis cervina]